MKRLVFLLAAVCSCTSDPTLLPMPQEIEWGKGEAEADKVAFCRERLGGGQNEGECLPASDEAYTLKVTKDSVIMRADTETGFLRAEQTLAQLTRGGRIRCCTVNDYPAFEWRGAMLDVSRHFLDIEFIKKHIDILSGYKVNRLHLHLTDGAGWRMEIKKYPRLTGFAAWRIPASLNEWWDGDRLYVEEGTPGAYGGYYTQDQLRDLVKYAEERGIMVIPEIEMPAHSEEVLAAYPEYSCTHVPYKESDFCPSNPATYRFLEDVLTEVMDVFPSEYIHIGGDEAGKASWRDCPLCRRKMKELGLKDVDGLQAYMIRHFGEFLKEHGRKLIGWDEVLDESLTDNSTVIVWRGIEIAGKAARMGYDVILSPGAYCYLDHYQDAPPVQPAAFGGYIPLEKVYSFNPVEGLSDEEKKHIKGVQGNVWAELIETPEHREYMLYPRILALAEIGWNGTAEKNYGEFRERAAAEVDRLRASGVNAFDLRNEVGNRKESMEPAQHKAAGAKVTYNLPFREQYHAAREATLTDGLRGGWNFNDGRWQGFLHGRCFDVTIDLGKSMDISSIVTTFYQSYSAWIYFPVEYTISISSDGTSFEEIDRRLTPVEKTHKIQVRPYEWTGSAQAQYIRLQATSGEAGKWLFVDEVEVY